MERTVTVDIDFCTITNEDFLKRLQMLDKIKESTREWYRNLLQDINSTGLILGKMCIIGSKIADDKITEAWTKKHDKAPSIDRRMKWIGALLTVGFISKITRAIHDNEYQDMRDYVKKLRNEYAPIREENNVKRLEGAPSLEELRKIVRSAPDEKHIARAVLAMYILMPSPCRVDLGDAQVHLKAPPESILAVGNHIVLGHNPRVILNSYKTEKTFGRIENEISAEVKAIILKSLKIQPRKYLFGPGAVDPLQCSLLIKRLAAEVIGRKMCVNDFRHIAASNIDIGRLNFAEYETQARKMGHGAITSLTKYRHVNTTRPPGAT